jgi:hypothetical protein
VKQRKPTSQTEVKNANIRRYRPNSATNVRIRNFEFDQQQWKENDEKKAAKNSQLKKMVGLP